jgi:hypothetical protein
MCNFWERLKEISLKIQNGLKKAHYHEFPILDENGEIVGYEIVSTRGGYSRTNVVEPQEKDDEEN